MDIIKTKKVWAAEDANGNDIWGRISPPSGASSLSEDPAKGLGNLISVGFNIFLIVAGLTMAVYLFWGAFDYITSGGDPEKIKKARGKIINAVIGIFVILLIISIYGYLAGDMLGILQKDPQGNWTINIPTIE